MCSGSNDTGREMWLFAEFFFWITCQQNTISSCFYLSFPSCYYPCLFVSFPIRLIINNWLTSIFPRTPTTKSTPKAGFVPSWTPGAWSCWPIVQSWQQTVNSHIECLRLEILPPGENNFIVDCLTIKGCPLLTRLALEGLHHTPAGPGSPHRDAMWVCGTILPLEQSVMTIFL